MADFKVAHGTTLQFFMRTKGFQAWRIPILLDCGAIKVLRDGGEIALAKGIKTHLDPDDVVRLPDPLPKKCREAIQLEATTGSRDYAFVPGTTKYDLAMGKLMEQRPNTTRIKPPGITTLAQFIRALSDNPLQSTIDPLITRAIDRIIVASHANDEGQLKLSLDGGADKFVDYEDLVEAIKKKSLAVDTGLLLPRPRVLGGDPSPAQFLVRGCRIGRQPVFLKKLKEALGSQIPVIAPRHFHAVDIHTKTPAGVLEYMAYSFQICSPKKLKRAAVIKAMKQAKHQTIDDKDVDPKKWEGWVPSNPHKEYEQKKSTSVKSPITNKVAYFPRTFRYQARSWLKTPEPLAMDKSKTKDDDRKKVLRDLLATRDEFKDSHPFPVYERYGYNTLDEFMDGWTWTFKPRGKAVDEVKFNATRHEYTVIQPITEPTTGVLIMNFYPTTKKGKMVELLKVTDKRMFETA